MEEKGKKLMPSNVHKKCIFNAHQPNDGENIYSRAFANEENINQYIADNYGQLGTFLHNQNDPDWRFSFRETQPRNNH